MKDKKIGVLGGGQLGMMLAEAAGPLGLDVHFLDPVPDCSVSEVSDQLTIGSFTDHDTVMAFGKDKDIITIEIEHVCVSALEALEEQGKQVSPSPKILAIIKDKGLQKAHYEAHGIPTAPFSLIDGRSDALDLDLPFVAKARTGGYDGQGVRVVRTEEDRNELFDVPMLIEQAMPFEKELAVIVARDRSGEVVTYPVVEMDFDPQVNLVDALLSPARVSDEVAARSERIAIEVMESFNMVGILAVEFFLMADGALLVNEVAPRPHNSGHQTIEGNETSQYEQHLRAITGLGLGTTTITRPSVMINLLGQGQGEARLNGGEYLAAHPDVFLHYYHKKQTRPYRKMGHLTVLGDTLESAEETANEVRTKVTVTAS